MESPSTTVTAERWQQAQEFELKVWQRQNTWYRIWLKRMLAVLRNGSANVGDDWNHWWYEKFDAYKAIPKQLDNAIELGCGPYTNMRLILKGRNVRYVTCSDPLASYYIRFRGQWLAQAYAGAEILLDNHPIEECPYADNYFDLVVLINVLDHVQDGVGSLATAIRIVKPGGYFVFGQDLTDESDAENIAEDIGHPIRLHHTDIDAVLLPYFESDLHAVLERQEGRNPRAHYGTYLFIGKKVGDGDV